MLFVSVLTMQSRAGPRESSSSESLETCSDSMKGDKKKERYGVISDCDRTDVSASTTESGDRDYHLEEI
jgi:hypothetical protein